MFGTVEVVAQSMPIHGGFSPWLVLLWLVLMAGCLLTVAGLVALYEFVVAVRLRRFQSQPPARRSCET